jgi:hypothetical protein
MMDDGIAPWRESPGGFFMGWGGQKNNLKKVKIGD